MYNNNLINACNILFGPSFKYNSDTLDYIQLSGIKSAYRNKSKLFHPDRSHIVGKDELVLTEYFKKINKAYNTLLSYKENAIKKSYSKTKSNKKPINKYNFYYKGNMPKTELRFSEFLYYSKRINWNELINSIVEQYNFRGKIGMICAELQFLKNDDINSIIRQKKENEKFGECAIRLNYLTINQLNIAIDKQKSKKYPIGRYFIDHKIISREELPILLHKNKQYNIKIRIKNKV